MPRTWIAKLAALGLTIANATSGDCGTTLGGSKANLGRRQSRA